ncbi:MAG: hypothetical protein MJY85_08255 [Fibrobacter sp.]|nr:hypothetical protein [Fibrobacter sp.]
MDRLTLFGALAGLAVGLSACGNESGGTQPAVEESSSSLPTNLSSSSSSVPESSASVIPGDTSTISYSLKAFEGPFTNPHKGFCVTTGGAWSYSPEWQYAPEGSEKNQAWNIVSHGCGYQRWNKLNPEKGVYDWTELEKLLNAGAAYGKGYGLRVFPYASPMGRKNKYTVESDYDWTPSYVYEAGAKKDYAKMTDGGVEYTLAVPRWDDPIYIQAAKDFAAALAAKYDGDPRLEYIDIRAFGNWGEWHIAHFDGSQMPSDEIEMDMLDYYASLFKKTLLVLPSNGSGNVYRHALSLGIAKRDDGLIATPWREDSLEVAYKAGLPTIGENYSTYAIMLTYDNIIPGGHLRWTPERWKEVIYKSHMTYYVLDQDEHAAFEFYKENKADADSLSKVLGYNFSISKAELVTVTQAADTPDAHETTRALNITVKNTGVAPCFFDIYIVAEFVNGEGEVLEQLGKTIHVPKGTFKDEDVKDFSFSSKISNEQTNVAALPGVSVALSIYESEEAFKKGENPTVKFDNDGLLKNNKLLLKQK